MKLEWRADAFGLVHGHWPFKKDKQVSLCSSINMISFIVGGKTKHEYPTCLTCVVIAYALPG